MLKQGLEIKQTQKLSPLQVQAIRLIEMPAQVLEQEVRTEMESNPVLDVDESKDPSEVSIDELAEEDNDIPGYRLKVRNWGSDPRPEYSPLSEKQSFSQNLEEQLGCRNLSEREFEIGKFIIGSLDSGGYLRRDIDSLVDDLAFRVQIETDTEEVLSVLRIVQDLEPAGIAARDLRECLVLQLKSLAQSEDVKNAVRILEGAYDEYINKHFHKVEARLSLTEDELKAADARIRKLNPTPGGPGEDSFAEQSRQIVPDFILEEVGDRLRIVMPKDHIPELKVSDSYRQMLQNTSRNPSPAEKETIVFVKQKVDSAKMFIEAIKQRHNTLRKTMEAILEYQYDYFLDGDEAHLKPMVLKDIAEKTGLDISTISRVVNSKYIETHFGIMSLKYFFSEGMENSEGEEVSTRELKKVLQECVDAEDKKKPLTDEQLVVEMSKRGYKVARRTIAKYRDQLGIPLARWRKEI